MSQQANINANPTQSTSTSSGGFTQGSNPMDGGANPFAPKPAPQEAAPQGSPNGLPSGTNPPSPNPTTQSAAPVIPSKSTGASPLDKYIKSKDNGPKGGETPAPNTPPADAPVNPFTIGNEQYQQLMANQNFVGDISPEMMTSIQQGDTAVLTKLINDAVLKGSSLASHFSTQVAQRGVDFSLNSFADTRLPETLNQHSMQQEWNTNGSDILKHEAVAPLAEAQMNVFKQQYPEASPQEIVEATRAYFEDFASALTSSEKSQETQASPAPRGIGGFFNEQ